MRDRQWLRLWFPRRRLDPDFPLVLWFTGLWFYLKSFLYLCYVYNLGLEPPPYSAAVKIEVAYFAAAMVVALFLGLAMWNEKTSFVRIAIIFLVVDTPLLVFHVLRLAQGGFLDSFLTRALELGSLTLNVAVLVWLITYVSGAKARSSRRPIG